MKDKIDAMNTALGANPTDSQIAQYESALIPIMTEFSRLSASMVTGDDIAKANNFMKQAKKEIAYVYDDLLTGPYGCEKDLELNRQPINPGAVSATGDKTWIVKATKRAEYPFKDLIWYDYNEFAPGAQLPTPAQIPELDPYTEKTTSNKMPPILTNNDGDILPANQIGAINVLKWGPGFLSAVVYDYNDKTTEGWYEFCDNITEDPAKKIRKKTLIGSDLDCLKVSDLFNKGVNRWGPSVGRKQYDGIWVDPQGITHDLGREQKDYSFEQTIGVY